MAAERLPIPVTSLATATLIGVVTTAAILLTAHPATPVGGLAIIAAVGGGFALASGLLALERRTPIGVAAGGIAVFVGTLSVGAALSLSIFDVPPVDAIAAGFAIAGVVTLAFVAVGYTDPASFTTHNWVLVQMAMPLFVLGPVLLNARVLSPSGSVSAVTGVWSAYLRAVSELGTQAAAFVVVHLFVVYFLIYVTSSRLEALDLVSDDQHRRISRIGLKATIVVGVVALVPALLSVAARIGAFSTEVPSLAAVAQLPALHWLLVGVEALLFALLCLCYVLGIIRWVRLEQAVMLAAYLVVPFVSVVVVTAALVLAPDELVNGRLLVHVPGPGGASIERLVGIGALTAGLVFVFVSATLTTLWLGTGVVYRLGSRGLPATASTGLFLGAVALGVTGAWPPIVACCLAGSILTWDVLENGVTLGEQLNGRFNAIQNEFAHGLASGAVGGLAVVIALGTYALSTSLQSGTAPSLLVLGPLLFAGAVFALALYCL
ncbi:DUF7519 family protein [Natrinema longum]|uniref:DUF7519 family protein n=1 Tax=Natrinema longum TaxID=370324 RepID=UPI001CCE78CE|nr:hypothetical protein [Natrinema longum]MBZ6496981.1 hypothetical protein [Natrinema longum]